MRERHCDPEIDFFSASFNPEKALNCKSILLPDPRALPTDNIFKARLFLPPDHPEAWSSQLPQTTKTQEQEEARRKVKDRAALANQQLRLQHQRLKVNPIDQLADQIERGPLLLLKNCYKAQGSVRVVTRHAHGIRGIAKGRLVAVDSYVNLVLQDVEETYTVLLKVRRGPEGKERTARRQEHRERRLKQIFIRGESIVLVSVL